MLYKIKGFNPNTGRFIDPDPRTRKSNMDVVYEETDIPEGAEIVSSNIVRKEKHGEKWEEITDSKGDLLTVEMIVPTEKGSVSRSRITKRIKIPPAHKIDLPAATLFHEAVPPHKEEPAFDQSGMTVEAPVEKMQTEKKEEPREEISVGQATRQARIIEALRNAMAPEQTEYAISEDAEIRETPRQDIIVVRDGYLGEDKDGREYIGTSLRLLQEDIETHSFKQLERGDIRQIIRIGEIKVVKNHTLSKREFGGLPEDPHADILIVYDADEPSQVSYYAPLPDMR